MKHKEHMKEAHEHLKAAEHHHKEAAKKMKMAEKHADAKEDKKLIRKEVKSKCMK